MSKVMADVQTKWVGTGNGATRDPLRPELLDHYNGQFSGQFPGAAVAGRAITVTAAFKDRTAFTVASKDPRYAGKITEKPAETPVSSK